MALFLNNVSVAGNLTRDPQVRFFANERAVADFGIAINRKFRDKNGEQREEVTFLDIEAWGRTAELAGQYLTKGRNCLVEGYLKLDQWDDKNDGSKRSKLKIVANRVHFLGGNEGGQGGGNNAGGSYQQQGGGGDSYQQNAPSASAPAAPSVPPPADFGDDEPPF